MADNNSKRKNDPDLTQTLILDAATCEFAENGFDGARVDRIAQRANVNKQLIYYYFTNKDELFTRTLELAYQNIRTHEAQLKLDSLPANLAILKLVEFTWEYYLKHPEFIQLLNSENQMKARHIATSSVAFKINQPWLLLANQLIERGIQEGNIRPNINAMQLNISISALGFFYLINQSTLSFIYNKDLMSQSALKERLAVIKETITCWISPPEQK
ncbi:TetR family transcriptional regulator [Salmonella enterica]|uniref:TetR/AcrR family transcriptional regulator n=4 Tax=Salmonella enterica TaxID=28901 RepID=A0A610XJY3_SALNE|nr:TetR/AcrR family transcriptional regulator [Salmonella enterica]EBR7996625.1 TetR/AcrR family transcriptional regulator [Salmonella enterica subsp. enterica serovar Panama]EBS4088825.1 TetR/AcrR family transcriptional regulator [Salmonella enterica subsp. enterica serovar Newport]EBV1274900.1 TetR/AcrR family transcriptional regulator [Salmonella enterica subsp. enterica serovar Oranienburg]EBW8395112.1 TetR/AcrR family transcriptional regulator [Salmonella enterica subsp. enterica serovar F